MKPITPFVDFPRGEAFEQPETTRYGRKSGVCAGAVLALVAVVLLSSDGGIDFLFLLFWSGPVALAGIIAGVAFGVRSMRAKEQSLGNRIGARLGIGFAAVLAFVVLGALLLIVSPPSFHA
jgi:tetrahydromethanopterin S-methyltransferase subunit G